MDLQKDYNLYLVFIKVCEIKNYSKVAELLNYDSHMSIKSRMDKLERQVKFKLFNSHPRGVEPTSQAIDLYNRVKPLFDAIDFAESDVSDFNENSTATLRIKFPTYFGSQIMSGYIEKFSEKYKNVRFEINGKKMKEAVPMLESNNIDIVLTAESKEKAMSETDTFGVIAMREVSTTLFASKQFAEKYIPDKKITVEQLRDLRLITLDKSYTVRGLLEKLGASTKPTAEVENTDIMLNLVSANMGIGYYVSEFFDNQGDKFAKIELVDAATPSFYLFCIYNKKHCSKAAKAFIDLMHEDKIQLN